MTAKGIDYYNNAVVTRWHNKRVTVIHLEEEQRVQLLLESVIKGIGEQPNPVIKRGDYIQIPMEFTYETAFAIYNSLNNLFKFELK